MPNVTHSNEYSFLQDDHLINFISAYVGTLLVTIGFFGNFISFLVFFKANRNSTKILTKQFLILLAFSNLVYLILFWYFSLFPRLVDNFKESPSGSENNQKSTSYGNIYDFFIQFNVINSNRYVCKLITYLINVSLFLNASIIASFSFERAVAVNFPLQTRHFRESHGFLFKSILALIFFLACIFPIYNLIINDIVEHPHFNKCDVPAEFEQLYFNLTIVFVVETLAIPFVVITLSNITIIIAIYKNKNKLVENGETIFRMRRLYRRETTTGTAISRDNTLSTSISNHKTRPVFREEATNNSFKSVNSKSSMINGAFHQANNRSFSLRSESHRVEFDSCEIQNSAKRCKNSSYQLRTSCKHLRNSTPEIVGNQSSLIRHGASNPKSTLYKRRYENLRITKMFISITLSFVFLNLPYFISWSYYALNRIELKELHRMETSQPFYLHSISTTQNQNTSLTILAIKTDKNQTLEKLAKAYNLIKLTELLNLFNYSFSSFLYFATGKIYREHLFSLLRIKYFK
jgi:hypothetical protein